MVSTYRNHVKQWDTSKRKTLNSAEYYAEKHPRSRNRCLLRETLENIEMSSDSILADDLGQYLGLSRKTDSSSEENERGTYKYQRTAEDTESSFNANDF